MKIATVHLAETPDLPAVEGFYQYVIAREGLYLRAANDALEAMVLVAPADRDLNGLAELAEYVQLRIPHIPGPFLTAVRASARRNLPNEAMYQFRREGNEWKVAMPKQFATPVSLTFDDQPETLLDLHSHGAMSAFFSSTDNGDEQGLRLYVVIGKVDSDAPEILCRVGVYGHFLTVSATDIFESLGLFVDKGTEHDLSIENEPDSTETETATNRLVAHLSGDTE